MNSKDLTERVQALRRRRLLWIAPAAAVLLVLTLWMFWPSKHSASTEYHTVRRGTFTVSIIEPGSLAAVSEVSIRSEVDGTARIIYIIPEGTFAKKGELLVELDSATAQDQINQQTINSEKARFALIQAQEQLAIQKSTVDSEIRKAELDLDFAKMDLDKFEKGQRVVDLIEASNKVVQAESQLSVNLETYKWTTNLAAKGYETKQKEDSDWLSVVNNKNNLIVASNTIWMLQEFDIPKQRAQFVSAVLEASNQLQRVVAQSKAKIAQAEADLLTQSNTLTLNQNKLARDQKNLDACRLLAPQDGLVVYAVNEGRFSSESLIEEGAVVRNRQELIKLPDTSRMKVTVKVHESHVNMIRRGLPAYVTLDSTADVRFAGVVERVGLLPDTQSRWANPNLKVYNTDIIITDPLPDVKPGVSSKAEIIITNIASTLSVPIQAVTTSRGRQVVYKLVGGEAQPVPVEPGLYNTKYIQILSGLSEGDRVLLAPPFDTHERDIEGEVLTPEEKAKVQVTNAPPAEPRPRMRLEPQQDTSLPSRGEPALAATTGANPEGGERPRRGGGGAGGGGGGGGFNREAMIKQYDTDGDGQLNETEREAMRSAMAARFSQNRGEGQGERGSGEGSRRRRGENTGAEAGANPNPPAQ